jgi:Zn-dependent protease
VSDPVFYRIDSSKVSLREYWWGSKSPLSLAIAAILKPLHIRIPSATDDPNVESLRVFQVPVEALPESVRTRFEMAMEELSRLGFTRPAIFHAIDDALHNCRQYLASITHESGRAIARVHNRIWAVRYPPKDAFFFEFLSELPDGKFLWSLSSKPDLLAPPNWPITRSRNATPEALWAMHQQHMGTLAADRISIVPVRNEQELQDALERHHAQVRDFHLKRGVFVPLSGSELIEQTEMTHRRSAGVEHADILAEIDRLQRKKTSWLTTIVLLGASLALFVLAFSIIGTGSQSSAGASHRYNIPWRFVWILIPILFFHELGHYLAMRVFRYRNVRMFFIPFLGAAVIGQNFSAPGWKKVIVALMGPLPGILLGGVLGFGGLWWHKPLWVEVAVLTLVLNALQLLPVMPLDGGRVVHTLFFSRHWMLDVGFRALAGVVLVGAWFFVHDWVLLIIGGFMLLSVPALYRLTRISTELRRQGIAQAPPADQFIPTEIAQAIIGRIKSAFGARPLSNKLIAQHCLTIYETIATRPPGAAATVGFALLHGISLVLAIALAAGLVFGQRGGMESLLHRRASITAIFAPKTPLDPGEIARRRGAGISASSQRVAAFTIVANFQSPVATDRAFNSAIADVPPRVAIERFGQSLLINCYSREIDPAWLERMKKLSPDIAVDDADHRVPLSLACDAPDETTAAAIEREISEYAQFPKQAYLIPPWEPDDARSTRQRAKDEQARQTCARAWDTRFNSSQDPAVVAIGKDLAHAYKAGDAKSIARLEVEQERVRSQKEHQMLDSLKRQPGVDAALVDQCLKEFDETSSPAEVHAYYRALGRRVGQLEMDADQPVIGADRYARIGGSVIRKGTRIQLNWLTFNNPGEAAPAIVAWLDQKGCTDFRYRFHIDER